MSNEKIARKKFAGGLAIYLDNFTDDQYAPPLLISPVNGIMGACSNCTEKEKAEIKEQVRESTKEMRKFLDGRSIKYQEFDYSSKLSVAGIKKRDLMEFAEQDYVYIIREDVSCEGY